MPRWEIAAGHSAHRDGASYSLVDDSALGNDRDAGLGHRKAALEVVLEIDADDGALLDDDVLIQNRLDDP